MTKDLHKKRASSRWLPTFSGIFFLQTASQGLSSVNNLALTLVIVSTSSVEGLGSFNLPFTIYLAALGVHRALIVDTVLATVSNSVFLSAQKASFLLSLGFGLALSGMAYAIDNSLMVIFGLFMPVLLLIDLRRNWAIVSGKPHVALCMDALWVMGTFSSPFIAPSEVEGILIVWALAGSLALLSSCLFKSLRASRRAEKMSFRHASRGIATSSTLESMLYQFGWQLPVAFALDYLSALLAGEYRLVVTIFGPLAVIVTSWTLGTYRAMGASQDISKTILRRALGIGGVSAVYWTSCLVFWCFLSEHVVGAGISLSIATLAIVGLQVPLTSVTSQLAVWYKRNHQASVLLICRMVPSVVALGLTIVALFENKPAYAVASLTIALATHLLLVGGQYARRGRAMDRGSQSIAGVKE